MYLEAEELTWLAKHWTSSSHVDQFKRLVFAAMVCELCRARDGGAF